MSELPIMVQTEIDKVKAQLSERAFRVSNVMRDSVFHIMTGGVSAPGEPPGVRTGNYRNSFTPSVTGGGESFVSKLTSGVLYGPFLEYGTSKMAPRPHCERILEDAKPQAIAIYSEPYV